MFEQREYPRIYGAVIATFAVVFAAGCIQTLPSAEALPATESVSTSTPIETDASVDWISEQSRTEDGLAMLGNPDAPVTFIDYSDFM